MRYISLFSGIGGFDAGFDLASMECVAQVEANSQCREVLAKHWPNVPRYEDVRNVGRHNLPPVDLICGGFPCQDLSVAGQRRGLDGERSGLWFEFHRILRELRPRWVVIENVPGLLSSNRGRDFRIIIDGLVELGYGVAWRVLDAQYFGVAQRRKRVFIVGSLGSGRAAQVLFEPNSLSRHSPPRRAPRPNAASGITNGAGSSGELATTLTTEEGLRSPRGDGTDNLITGTLRSTDARVAGNANEDSFLVAHTLTTGIGRRMNPTDETFIHSFQCHGGNVGPHGTLRGGQSNVPAIAFSPTQITSPVNRSNPQPDDPCHTLTDNKAPAIAFAWQQGTQGNDDRIVRAGDYAGAVSANRVDAVLNQTGVRRLTPRECERLQGFPDNWTSGQSDSARYRMAGNAVAVPVAEWIGQRIMVIDTLFGRSFKHPKPPSHNDSHA